MAREIPFSIYKALARAIENEVETREEEKFNFEFEVEPFYFNVNVKVECDIYEDESGNTEFTFYDFEPKIETCCFTLETEDDYIQEECLFDEQKYSDAVDDNTLEDYYAKMLRKSIQVLGYNPVAELDRIINTAYAS